MLDYLIVGSGLFGATVARRLHDDGAKVLVIERRDHIGGNCHDVEMEGINVHSYGPHTFHTNSPRVWRFVNQHATWEGYEHKVLAHYDGHYYSFPPNLMTYQQLGLEPGGVADDIIFELFFRGYTEKQWGCPVAEVPSSVLSRVPFRDNWDDRYHTDRWQALPRGGYRAFFERLLDGIGVELGADYLTDAAYWRGSACHIVYSGPLDALFGYKLGRLRYRSLVFRTELLRGDVLRCAGINYPDPDVPFTRAREWKWFGWHPKMAHSVVTWEYPVADGEPYYPFPDEANRRIAKAYREMAASRDWLTIGGRLGNWQYLNMDQAIAQALRVADGLLETA